MKTKLCVAGIGGCLLLMSYFKPYVMFSSNPAEQSREELKKSQGLLNYEKSNIPGLEVKTPAKIAIVNKLEVAKMKKATKKEKIAPAKNNSDNDWLASLEKSKKQKKQAKDLPLETKIKAEDPATKDEGIDDLDNNESDINPSVSGAETANSSKPLVNMPKPGSNRSENVSRTVINYASNSYVENTSNTKFPHDEDVAEATTIVKEVSVTRAAVAEKSEKMYAFRGKTSVKSSLYKYIPPFWDGFSEELGANKADYNLVIAKARQLAKIAAQKGCNTEFAFLLDMSVKSNKNRFFVVNLKTFAIESSSLVAQGRGKQRLNLDKDYSNTPGSNCSSLGMYKIGQMYDGDFGRSYRLNGMDATNKNALKRFIVLHAMGSIPNEETNFPIWQSEGCPSVSTAMLEKLGSMIDASKKPVLMWMYDETYIPQNGKSMGSNL